MYDIFLLFHEGKMAEKARDPQHLFETFARWNTNIRLTSGNDIHREIEFALEQFNIFLADVGCNPINDENPTD